MDVNNRSISYNVGVQFHAHFARRAAKSQNDCGALLVEGHVCGGAPQVKFLTQGEMGVHVAKRDSMPEEPSLFP